MPNTSPDSPGPIAASPGVEKTGVAGTDGFGNPVDPGVGYARGALLRSSEDENLRLAHCQRLATQRVIERGLEAIAIFTGNTRDFPLLPGDQDTLCEEWVGLGWMQHAFQEAAVGHVGGDIGDRSDRVATLLNRTSAGIIATIHALAQGRPLVSLVPRGGRSHASVRRGAALARVELAESDAAGDWRALIDTARPALVIVTAVTSNLDILADADIAAFIAHARRAGAVALVDDAYGARLRPVLCDGQHALALGADMVITNGDKSGLHGPRSGILVGTGVWVDRVMTRASEWGMEARAPVMAGTLRALQAYRAEHLRAEASAGQALTLALTAAIGPWVEATLLGPLLREDAMLRHLLRLRDLAPGLAAVVPCEATAAVGVVLLRDHGILTTNTHGQPGASAALRLKPTERALARAGGIDGVTASLRSAIDTVADLIDQPQALRHLLLGQL